MPRGRKKKVVSDDQLAINVNTMEDDTGENSSDEELIVLDNAQTIGMIIPSTNRSRYVILKERHYYTEETTTWSPRGGDVVYPAGSYGPWMLSDKPYPGTIGQALVIAAEKIMQRKTKESIKEAKDLHGIIDHINAAKRELDSNFRKYKYKE